MKKVIILGALAAILSFSCNNDKNERDASTTNAIGYKISELPTAPSFAKPIKEAGEVRKFDLIKKDGSKLNFELTSIKQTLFGKMRTLVGTVSTGDTKKEKAIMIVGENGFELFYSDNGQDFKLKGKNELNIGIKMNNFNLEGKSRTQFLAYAKKKGLDSNLMLNNLNKKTIDTESRYEVVVEQSNQYALLNQTAASQKKESVEGVGGKCSEEALPSSTSDKVYNKNAENSEKSYHAYNIEIMYMNDTYYFTDSYADLLKSLYSVDSEFETNSALQPNVSQFPAPKKPLSEDTAEIDAYFDYWYAFIKTSDIKVQLKNMTDYGRKHPTTISDRYVRVALFRDQWDNGAGVALVGQYNWKSDSSSLVSGDSRSSNLAHECGHNLGAWHTDDSNDVMYTHGSHSTSHLNVENIANIKKSLKY